MALSVQTYPLWTKILFYKRVMFANAFLFIPFIQDDNTSNSLEDTSMFNVTPDGHILQVCGGHRTYFTCLFFTFIFVVGA